jgi:ATP-binding cassette, subfamily B, bacterial PglK
MNTYRLIKKLLVKSEKKELIFLFFGSVIMGLLETIGIAAIVPFMAVASDPSIIENNQYLMSLYTALSFSAVNDFVIFLGAVLIALMLFSNTFNAFIVWRVTKFSYLQGYGISRRMLDKYLSQQYVYFLDVNTSSIVKNILTEVDRTVSGVILPLLGMSSKIVTVVFIIIMLIIFNPTLAITMFLFLSLVYTVLYMLIRKKMLRLGSKSTELIEKRYRVVFEAMSGIKDVIMKNTRNNILSEYSKSSFEYAEISALGNAISELPRYALELIIFGGMVVLTVYLLMYDDSSMFITTLSLYAMAGYRLMPSAQLIFRASSTIRYTIPVLQNVVKELKKDSKEIECDKKIREIEFNSLLQLKNIEYTYPNSKNKILDKLCIDITPNTMVGIVGMSGSGKTTLIDILLGLISPDKGSIKVDNVEINEKNVCAWRGSIGYVPQDVFIMDDSIINNIAYGKKSDDIDKSIIKSVVSLTGLNFFVESMTGGYYGEIGERGSKMSGGQRQRLGIARALYNDPDLLVFDEATSSLDGVTEDKIINSIYNLKDKKTIIMVAHKTSTLKGCDVIYLIQNGKVGDFGTYEQLIENNTLFRRMSINENTG